MENLQSNLEKSMSFSRLMRLGQISFSQGDHNQAHYYWKRAALCQPDNEAVWLALLQILFDEADRRVCLRNIITINPKNIQARKMLAMLEGGLYTPPPTTDYSDPDDEASSSPLGRLGKQLARVFQVASLI